MTTRRTDSKEYKSEAMRLAEAAGDVAQTVRDPGIKSDMIHRCRKHFEEPECKSTISYSPDPSANRENRNARTFIRI